MKRWFRMAWILLTNVSFAILISSRALDEARLQQLLSPEPTSLWWAFFRSWRLDPGVFIACVWLAAGIGLEIFDLRFAKYVNLGFFAIFMLLLLPGFAAAFRGKAEPEAVTYMIAFRRIGSVDSSYGLLVVPK
jgi:hypothetical protein